MHLKSRGTKVTVPPRGQIYVADLPVGDDSPVIHGAPMLLNEWGHVSLRQPIRIRNNNGGVSLVDTIDPRFELLAKAGLIDHYPKRWAGQLPDGTFITSDGEIVNHPDQEYEVLPDEWMHYAAGYYRNHYTKAAPNHADFYEPSQEQIDNDLPFEKQLDLALGL